MARAKQGMPRHSEISTTMNLYTQDDRDEKQTAQGAFLSAIGLEVVWCSKFVDCHCRYQLNLSFLESMAGTTGLEPATSAVTANWESVTD
jgi:hypothetical protein